MSNTDFNLDVWLHAVDSALALAKVERIAQLKKWGPQGHNLPVYFTILGEEVGELAEAILAKEFDTEGLYGNEPIAKEAIQVAAVALAIVQLVNTGKPA